MIQGRPATRKGPAGVGVWPAAWECGQRRGSVAGWKCENLTKSEKFKHESEKFKHVRTKSEKFKRKVRN